jgi:hypothetical protein
MFTARRSPKARQPRRCKLALHVVLREQLRLDLLAPRERLLAEGRTSCGPHPVAALLLHPLEDGYVGLPLLGVGLDIAALEQSFEALVLELVDFSEHVDGSLKIELDLAPICRDEMVEYILEAQRSRVRVLDRRLSPHRQHRVPRDAERVLCRRQQVGRHHFARALQSKKSFRTIP